MLNRRDSFGAKLSVFQLFETLLLFALCSKMPFWSEVEPFFRLLEALLRFALCSKRPFWSEVYFGRICPILFFAIDRRVTIDSLFEREQFRCSADRMQTNE